MPINLFQFDWIIIDTVVIILLIVFLVSVKIFKERFRWRSTLSNIALEQFIFDKQSLELTNQNIIVKNISITVNNVLKSKNMLKPSIVIFRSTKNKRLVKVLTEALARDKHKRTGTPLNESRRQVSTFIHNVHHFIK